MKLKHIQPGEFQCSNPADSGDHGEHMIGYSTAEFAARGYAKEESRRCAEYPVFRDVLVTHADGTVSVWRVESALVVRQTASEEA